MFENVSGTFSYFVQDNVGCIQQFNATLSRMRFLPQIFMLTFVSALTASSIPFSPLCEGGLGTVKINASGGTEPYIYSVSLILIFYSVYIVFT